MVVEIADEVAMADSPIFSNSWLMCQEPQNCKSGIMNKNRSLSFEIKKRWNLFVTLNWVVSCCLSCDASALQSYESTN